MNITMSFRHHLPPDQMICEHDATQYGDYYNRNYGILSGTQGTGLQL